MPVRYEPKIDIFIDRTQAMNNLPVYLIIFFLLMIPASADYGGSVQVNSDIPSVPVYIDDEYIGVAPVTLLDINPGYHLVRASPVGYFAQIQSIIVEPGSDNEISFIFRTSDQMVIPAMVRIGECVGTPEPSDLNGIAYNLLKLSDGTLMVYFSGWNEGITCKSSPDGITWNWHQGSCLDTGTSTSGLLTEPWVFPLSEGGYRMIYRQSDGKKHQYYSAFSSDGRSFQKEDRISFNDTAGSPLTGGDISVPTGIVYPDGTIRMYYTAPGSGINSAVSNDNGLTWALEEGSRIKHGTDPTSVLLSDGRTGLFYVDLTPKSKGHRIFFSLSEDGVDFSLFDHILIMETIEPGVWLMDPELTQEGDQLKLYFSVVGVNAMQSYDPSGILKSVVNLNCLAERASL